MNSKHFSSDNSSLFQPNPVVNTPSGIIGIYNECRRIYPDQINPLQISAVVKFWLGGPDPLDYISMHANSGDEDTPPHWHYVTFGLSDLHGDSRVHEHSGHEGQSGFGFELTFRLKREITENHPPTWPANLLQTVARYVFQTQNILNVGDHIPWNMPLDGLESKIQHLLMAPDPQLRTITTAFGSLCFIQMVGICLPELKAVQQWNGNGILELLRTNSLSGGKWLITNIRRDKSIFELNQFAQQSLDNGIEEEGSNLGGVGSKCFWNELHSKCNIENFSEKNYITEKESFEIKETLIKGLQNSNIVLPHSNRSLSRKVLTVNDFENTEELQDTEFLNKVHIYLNLEAAELLPLVLRGRIKHRRHFTFKSIINQNAITFVSENVEGSIVTEHKHFASKGLWLQILISDKFADEMLCDLDFSNFDEKLILPTTYDWSNYGLTLTITSNDL